MTHVRKHPVLIVATGICAPLLLFVTLVLFSTWYDGYGVRRVDGRADVRVHLHGGICTITASRTDGNIFFLRWDDYWLTSSEVGAHEKKHFDGATTRRGFGPVRMLSGTVGTSTFSLLRFPFWPLLLVLPIPLVALCVVGFRGHKDQGLHLCPDCGYDLTNCIKRCAECGWTMPYPLVLRLALARDVRKRRSGGLRPSFEPRASQQTTKPTDSSVGSVR
jgi:hypothetical protein